jgi:hypothetical protein
LHFRGRAADFAPGANDPPNRSNRWIKIAAGVVLAVLVGGAVASLAALFAR